MQDSVTGDSLCYGFVEFDSEKHCQDAFFKMDNVLIDERCAMEDNMKNEGISICFSFYLASFLVIFETFSFPLSLLLLFLIFVIPFRFSIY